MVDALCGLSLVCTRECTAMLRMHDADDSDEQCVMVSSELRKRQDHGVNEEDAMPDATRFICGQDLLSICYISSDTSLSEADRDQKNSARGE